MYEEEKKGSFIKDLIIKLLYMLLFLFLFMWLYPAPKVDLSDVKVKVDKSELEPLYAGIFSDNITSMKEAARNYFTTDRLPSTNGGKVKLTLQEMLNKKMLVPFVDKNGNSCDTNASYVEVTRNSTYDYNLKVYLACGNEKDYIVDTIGCTSICPGCVNTPTVSTNTSAGTTKTYGYGGGSTSTTNNTTIYTPSSTTTTVKPTEKKEQVTVSFNTKGGSYVSSQTFDKGLTATEPSTTKDGNTFLCWSTKYNDSSCSDAYNFSTPVYKNITLYAQWATEKQTVYEYVKNIDTWTLNNTWTTSKKSGSNVREYDRRTVTDTDTKTNSYTYRSQTWYHGFDNTYSYGLYLNNIPSNATNVRLSSSPRRYTSISEMEAYVSNVYSCNTQMIGYGCPTRGAEGNLDDSAIYTNPVGNFSFTTSGIKQSGGRWQIYFYITNTGSYNYNTQYIAPIKFTVSWDTETTRRVTQYKYEYLSTTKDYKYSTNKNDTSLLNNGYRLTGNTK